MNRITIRRKQQQFAECMHSDAGFTRSSAHLDMYHHALLEVPKAHAQMEKGTSPMDSSYYSYYASENIENTEEKNSTLSKYSMLF